MQKKWLGFFFVIMFIMNIYIPVNANESASKNILIINSYHQGFQWTDDQTSGFLSGLGAQDVDVFIEYLDWKRFSSTQNLEHLYESMKSKYVDKNIDIIYCTDDAAFEFALKYRKEIFSDAPIVFSGINAESLMKIGANHEQYTGVIEEVNPESTIKAALEISPSIENIYLIFDNTESGLSTGSLCVRIIEQYFSDKKITLLNHLSSQNIINSMSSVDDNSMVLITTYFTDTDGTSINHGKFCETLADVSPVPIYHLYDFGMGRGVLGGNLLQGLVQGQEAAKLALRVLDNEDINTIGVVKNNTESFVFDYQAMTRYNITESKLPKDSLLINEPFSFYKTYRTLVNTVLGIFAFLVLFIFFLTYHIHKIRRMRRDLLDSHEELTGLYEELSATEEELRTKYGEIADSRGQLEEYSQKLLFQSHHNDLTGLFNRRYLYEVVKNEFACSHRAAFLYIDLDNFSYINDVIGHANGDKLLIQISGRLSSLRSQNAELIHLSGDEFIFLLKSFENREEVETFIEQIMEAFSLPFNMENHSFTIKLSIGVSLCPQNGNEINTLISNADLAMFKVKEFGKNGHYFFDDVLRHELMERVKIENGLHKALDQNEFVLYYQPQINQFTQTIEGFEALVRWDSSEFGFMAPNKFIPIAEENGFISVLGEWVLIHACQYMKQLNQRMNSKFKVSVNISVIQIVGDDFINIVKNALQQSDLSPELLELEITESTIMKSTELVVEKIKELRKLGIYIALDDFGTGYSSMSHLRHISLSTIKIDKSFMNGIPNSVDNANIIRIIMDLGEKFNLTVVAEGVEREEQLQFLKAIGCSVIQGYIYSRPLPESEIEDYIERFKKS